MKIGILTFHWAHNYGAVLQVYALQKYLQCKGNDVVVIDYNPVVKKQNKKINVTLLAISNPILFAKKCIGYFLSKNNRILRTQNFVSFTQNYLCLKEVECLRELDLIVLGSDQIWNKKILGGFNDMYWGNFTRTGKQKVISYAASMEIENLTNKEQNIVKHFLSNLDGVSVREDKLNEILTPLTDKKIVTVVDPTLLVDVDVWNEIVKIPKDLPNRYVLIYQVTEDSNLYDIANKIANELGIEVIELGSYTNSLRKNFRSYYSPTEFLGVFKNADFVVTSSFHGAIFSINFRRDFYAVKRTNWSNTRIQTLISSTELQSHLIEPSMRPSFNKIDYSEIDEVLLKNKMKSQEYIDKHLL